MDSRLRECCTTDDFVISSPEYSGRNLVVVKEISPLKAPLFGRKDRENSSATDTCAGMT